MTVKLLFFGVLSELILPGPIEMELSEGATVADARQRVLNGHPNAKAAAATAMVAVNQRYSNDETLLADGDEVAFLPPVSGG